MCTSDNLMANLNSYNVLVNLYREDSYVVITNTCVTR